MSRTTSSPDAGAVVIVVGISVVRVRGARVDRRIRDVDQPVAVVIDAVADLVRTWIDRRVAIVAIGRVRDVARGRDACSFSHRRIAEAIAVDVTVEHRSVRGVESGVGIVDLAVAVVIDAIADLVNSGMTRGIVISTVATFGDVASGSFASVDRLGSVSEAIAVYIGVELLRRTGSIGGVASTAAASNGPGKHDKNGQGPTVKRNDGSVFHPP